MKKDSFYSFIMKQLSRNGSNKMNLPTYTKVIRKKAQSVSTAQLLYVYKQLHRIKQNQSQFHLSIPSTNPYQRNRSSSDISQVMKIESYQKHTLICLEEIAIKLKQKHGYQEGVDLCKLFYLRLINAIEYHLPYVNVLEQFREQFLWRDLGEELIDYIAMVEKDPTLLSPLYRETVQLIIDTISEELQTIDPLQLPYLKSVISKASNYAVYHIQPSFISHLDSLIDENKFIYSFKELQSSLTSHIKNKQTHLYYALNAKDPIEKKLNYLYTDSRNHFLCTNKQLTLNELKSQVGLPGKIIDEENLQHVLKRMNQVRLFGVYLNIFPHIHHEKQITKTSTLRHYITYHFKYFINSGNVKYLIKQVTQTLANTLQTQQIMQQKGLKFEHLELLKLFFVIQMLARKQITSHQLIESHQSLQEELKQFNLVQKPKLQHIAKIFQNSLNYHNHREENLQSVRPIIKSFTSFIENSQEKLLSALISQELQTFTSAQKAYLMKQLILSLLNSLLNNHYEINQIKVIGKLLEIFIKLQYKKFSTQSSNSQKLIALIQQKESQLKELSASKSENVQNLQLNSIKNGSEFNQSFSEEIIEKQHSKTMLI